MQRTKTPPLVPEDAEPIWSRGTDKILSSSKGMKHGIGNVINKIYDQLGDPRIGPVLLLAALISFGSIWLRRSQSARPSEPNHSSQPDVKVSDGFGITVLLLDCDFIIICLQPLISYLYVYICTCIICV